MNVQELEIKEIKTGDNFRVNDSDVATLMSSIKQDGLLNPITVKKTKKGYELLAGFRRLTAIRKLGHHIIPANILESETAEKIVINLIENLQRQDTTSWEVGRGIATLKKQENMSLAELAARLGLHVQAVKSYLNLFSDIPVEYRDCVSRIEKGHNAKKGQISNSVANSIIVLRKNGKINVAQTRELFAEAKRSPKFTSNHVREIGNKYQSGSNFANAKELAKNTKSIRVEFKVKKVDYNRINKEYQGGFHGAIREVVADSFGIKLKN